MSDNFDKMTKAQLKELYLEACAEYEAKNIEIDRLKAELKRKDELIQDIYHLCYNCEDSNHGNSVCLHIEDAPKPSYQKCPRPNHRSMYVYRRVGKRPKPQDKPSEQSFDIRNCESVDGDCSVCGTDNCRNRKPQEASK